MAFMKKNAFPKFEDKVWLASPCMHPESLMYMETAFTTNWMSTVGENINEAERAAAEEAGVRYAVALSSCTAALHLCAKLAGEKLYGKPEVGHGALEGRHVFCSDMTFAATLNPVVYEGAIPVFIDTDADTWDMNPKALEKAFEIYPDTKLVVAAELYGFPGRMDEIKRICEKHGALLIEDAAEALGAKIAGSPCGSFGDYAAISYNGNKIITGSSGGCFLTNAPEDAAKVRKWSTQSREQAAWYQHEEVGYNYRMSNVIAGVVRGQYPYLKEHIAQKKRIYDRYEECFRGYPLKMIPVTEGTEPNYWLSACLINKDAVCRFFRDEMSSRYTSETGKTCPTEVLEALEIINAEGRPIWKPMHLQPMYRKNPFVTAEHTEKENRTDVGSDIFCRGLCLPSDINMTTAQQDRIIEVIQACFE